MKSKPGNQSIEFPKLTAACAELLNSYKAFLEERKQREARSTEQLPQPNGRPVRELK